MAGRFWYKETMSRDLVAVARQAARQAYAPYSGYAVGAALEARDGTVYSGCNVENASYGLTICAERAAVAAAIAAGRRSFRRIAIAALRGGHPLPCGACRQVLAEFGLDMEVAVVGPRSARRHRLRSLLPRAFSLGNAGAPSRGTPKYSRRKRP